MIANASASDVSDPKYIVPSAKREIAMPEWPSLPYFMGGLSFRF